MAKTLSISLGKFEIELRLSRSRPPVLPSETQVNLGCVRALERRFTELRDFGLSATVDNALELADFYVAVMPLNNPRSRGAWLRSRLHRLRDKTKDSALKAAATRAIVISDLEDGLPDRAGILANDPIDASPLDAATHAFNAAHGSPLIGSDLGKADRGDTLIVYFDAHRELLRGKDIFHFAPEARLRAWLLANRTELGIGRYVTADGFDPDVDEHHDITHLDMPDSGFDLVICHRVMEHVLDDAAAFSELYRVLRPGGLLNFSVPQAPQQAETHEWAIPDESHDGHVRRYGADLAQRIANAGFRVELEPWLLQQSVDSLRTHGAYPMQIYHGWRDA